jgi:hypothetical protein
MSRGAQILSGTQPLPPSAEIQRVFAKAISKDIEEDLRNEVRRALVGRTYAAGAAAERRVIEACRVAVGAYRGMVGKPSRTTRERERDANACTEYAALARKTAAAFEALPVASLPAGRDLLKSLGESVDWATSEARQLRAPRLKRTRSDDRVARWLLEHVADAWQREGLKFGGSDDSPWARVSKATCRAAGLASGRYIARQVGRTRRGAMSRTR